MRFLFRGAAGAALAALALLLPLRSAAAQAPLPAPVVQNSTSPPDIPLLRLEDLLQEVPENPSLRAAYMEADALATRAAQVSALPDPMAMGTYQPFPVYTARGTQRSQWRVEQQIPYPGKLSLQGDIADLSAEVAQWEAETFREDLTLQVKGFYYDLYRVQQQIELVEAFQQRLTVFEDVAVTQYEVGTGMQQAVLKAQLEKNTLSQRIIDLQARQRTAAEGLARVLNRPVEGAFAVRVAPPEPVAAGVERLVNLALEWRPEVEALEAAERRAEKSIDLAQKQFMPDFGLSLTYFDMADRGAMPSADGRDAVALGVSVKVPFQRGRLRAGLQEARLRAAQVQARQEALTTTFQTQIADLTNQLAREAEQMTLYRERLIPQAETTLEATVSAYTTGRTDFLNLLDTERMLFSLQMGYEDALARYLRAAAALERAVGVGDLGTIDSL